MQCPVKIELDESTSTLCEDSQLVEEKFTEVMLILKRKLNSLTQ